MNNETQIDLSSWYASTFDKPARNYTNNENRIDLSVVKDNGLVTEFVRSISQPVTSAIYEGKSMEEIQNNPDVGYQFYFSMMNCSNATILEHLYIVWSKNNGN